MEYQSEKVVLRKDRKSWDVSPTPACAFRLRELHDHAAMVFEEAGRGIFCKKNAPGPSVRRSGHPCSFY